MTKLSKVTDQLMGLTISELTQVQNLIHEVKTMKAKAALSVGANVFVVQKTKKTPGVIEKINQKKSTCQNERYTIYCSFLNVGGCVMKMSEAIAIILENPLTSLIDFVTLSMIFTCFYFALIIF